MSIPGTGRQLVTLLVEDNPADVFLIRQAILSHSLDIDLYVASDGDEAYEFIERAENDSERSPRPELVLLDLNLPKRSGREVLERLRQSAGYSTVPVVILTSSDLSDDRKELSALGADRYFCKPSTYDEFLKIGAVIKELLPAVSNAQSTP
jgi:chemotaxis family two-component system response regulator Rcp1